MAASSTSRREKIESPESALGRRIGELESRVNSLELENLELRKRSLRESAERWNAVSEAASLKAQIAASELYKLTEKDGANGKSQS